MDIVRIGISIEKSGEQLDDLVHHKPLIGLHRNISSPKYEDRSIWSNWTWLIVIGTLTLIGFFLIPLNHAGNAATGYLNVVTFSVR